MVAASIPRERKAAAEAMSRVLGSGRVLMAAAKGGAKEAAAARVVTKVAAAAPPAAAAATPPKVGLRKPVPVSPALRKFLGVQESTRMEVVKKIWEHIKANQLQNPKNKQEIRCDEKLKTIFDGKDKVGMLEMGKLLNPHFLKP
ncbi:protein TRI1-like [Zingiber officinale]|uniref:protein TRI1-like n=1 Tax=Zingiber officinale TaxID=94328 RepID=UPI001C4A8DFA|nr:protein TRI1-like [Zingiber officinale]